MTDRDRMLTLDPEAAGKVTIRFDKYLLDGEVIADATAVVQKRTAMDPEAWDAAAGLTATPTVVDAYKDDGVTLIAADQAVQVLIEDADEDTGTPARGDGYRVMVTATIPGRDVPLVAKNELYIRP